MSGYDNIFRGIIKCADCGSAMLVKVENKRKRDNVLDKTFYCCTKYRKYGKGACSAHNIEARTVQEELTTRVKELEKSATADKEQLSSIKHFAEHISDFAGITELALTPEGLQNYVDSIRNFN